MSTTTIRLPEDLKARVAALAERAGTTPHGFILQAIAEKAAQEEQRAHFDEAAERRYARIVATGRTIPWPEMRRYLEDRVAGKPRTRPVARKLVAQEPAGRRPDAQEPAARKLASRKRSPQRPAARKPAR